MAKNKSVLKSTEKARKNSAWESYSFKTLEARLITHAIFTKWSIVNYVLLNRLKYIKNVVSDCYIALIHMKLFY